MESKIMFSLGDAALFAGAMFALAMMLFVTSDWAEGPQDAMMQVEGN
jgi:hypothetical protein